MASEGTLSVVIPASVVMAADQFTMISTLPPWVVICGRFDHMKEIFNSVAMPQSSKVTVNL